MGQELFVDHERRVSNFNNAYSRGELPDGVTQEVIPIIASDGAASVGVLHKPADSTRVCVVYMHPKTNQSRPYLAPALLRSQIAVWGQLSRHINNDTDMTHEEVVLDLAAAMRMLRTDGFKTIIAVGNSGGSSLLAYYQSVASQPPSERQEFSPAREPTGFRKEEMPAFDLYVALAPHLGEGTILLNKFLDPAVVDENDPTQTYPALDMFDARNGYRPFPEPSRYDPAWLTRYRAAQVERCRRLDLIAHNMLADYATARAAADPAHLETIIARRALYARVMIIHRTYANPGDLDLTISPSRRPIGAPGGGHPIRNNYGMLGFARIITPRAWLSTWSGLSSKAELLETLHRVNVPSLFVYPDGDFAMYPDDAQKMLDACAAKSKKLETIAWGLHYLMPVKGAPADLAPPKVRAGNAVVDWIKSQLGH